MASAHEGFDVSRDLSTKAKGADLGLELVLFNRVTGFFGALSPSVE